MAKRILALLLTLVLVLSIAACANKSTPAESSPGNTAAEPSNSENPDSSAPAPANPSKTKISIAIANDPGTLDICGTPSNSAWDQISFNIYDFLYTLDSNNNEIPLLAEKWEQKDESTFIFYLRQGVKFSDGSTFDAKDVLASLLYYKDSPSGKMPVASVDWDKTKVIDDNTIEVGFISPGIALFGQICYWRITSEEACQDADEMKSNPVGTGAYMLEDWVSGTSMTLVSNPNYWGEKGVIERAVYNVITDASQRTNALLAGDVDLIIQTSAKDVDLIESDGKYTVHAFSDSKCDTILFNCSEASVMKDADLRKAVAYATDRVGIQNAAYFGHGKIANAPIPSVFRDYDSSWQLADNYYAYDMDKAKTSFQKSGVAEGTPLTIISNGGSEQMVSAQVIQASLLNLGFVPEIVTYDPAVYQKTILDPSSKWDICLVSMGSPQLVTADMYLGYFINQPYCFYGASNPNFETAIKERYAITVVDKTAAKELIDMEINDLPHLAYMETPIYDSFSTDLQNFTTWYTRMVPLRLLSFS